MTSQTDWDQGGTTRQLVKLYLGPSVGWVLAPDNNILFVTTPGTTVIALGTTLILVNCAGLVNLTLPSALASPAGAQALPGTFLGRPITVIDYGGNAGSFPITITPYGSETIDGFSPIKILTAYGVYTLNPNTPLANWTLRQ